MLINGGTRSGKEVLTYGFKKYQLGELIGTRTEGAVLAATAFLIGSGLLLLAVEDVWVDGERLEGVGRDADDRDSGDRGLCRVRRPPTEPCSRGSLRDVIWVTLPRVPATN
jgi:hypothetical protein